MVCVVGSLVAVSCSWFGSRLFQEVPPLYMGSHIRYYVAYGAVKKNLMFEFYDIVF